MTSMKDFLTVGVNDDPNSITNELYVENTVETPTWYTVEDNRASSISEDVGKIIKVETDLLENDCTWKSRIDVAKYGEKSSSSLHVNVHQNSSISNYFSNPEPSFTENFLCYICGQPFAVYFDLEHHLEIHHELTQNVSCYNSDINNGITNPLNAFLCDVCGESFILDVDFRKHIQEHNKTTENVSDSGLNCENSKLLKTFCCDICGKCFVLELDLDNHLREHMKQKNVNTSLFKCNFCEKEFKLNFLLNKHIKKCHNSDINNVVNMRECSICKTFVDEAVYDEHVKAHRSSAEKDTDFIVNLKLSKLNGVWKSKPNFVYKCNICDEKFQNEVCLTEHMTIHKRNDNQKQSEDGLNTTPISRLNDYIQHIHDSNNFKCQKCNLKFDKRENLDLHTIYCTKSSRNIWSKFLGSQNISKVSVGSPVYGINFNNSQFIICKFCQTTFDTKELWSKHVDVCRKHNKCEHINKTGVNEAQNQNVLKNTSIPNLKKENIQRSQLSLRKMSDLLDSTANNYNQSVIEPSNLFKNNCNIRIKRLKAVCSNVSDKKHTVVIDAGNESEVTKQTVLYNLVDENNGVNVESNNILYFNDVQQNSLHIQNTENINETVVQVAQSDLMVNDCRPFIKKEKGLCLTVNEVNSLNQVNLSKIYKTSLPEPHNEWSYNRDLCIKKERWLNTNAVESNNFGPTHYTSNRPECTMLSETSQTIVKQEPINLESNIVECIERETIYFTVKETTFKGNACSKTKYHNYEQILESNVLCVCKICKKSFTNTHTLALHMSNHQECSMHECVVCNETFETVLLWTSHMTFHQQQEDLILLKAHNNSIITESNVTDTSYVVSTESQTMTTEGNKNKTRLRIKQELGSSHSDVSTSLNINAKILKTSHFNSTLPHQTISSIMKSFSCKYCDRTFTGQGPLTNHEKSHTNPNKNKLLVPDVDDTMTTFDQAETNFDVQVENNTINSVTIQPQIQSMSLAPKRFSCLYCNKKFVKKCHRTNHMRFLHKKNSKFMTPKTLEIENNVEINETGSVNTGEQSFKPSPEVKSIKDHKNNSLVSVTTNLSNINVKSKGNVVYCTVCQKKFVHIGALANHMHVHSNRKPYKCRYCNRTFNMKGPYILHERKHKNVVDVNNIQAQNLRQVNVEMTEVKDGEEEQLQLELKENLNDFKFFDTNLNGNLNSKNSTKKNRMWFVCDVCDKKFSTPYQLILHRRLRHDSVTPYVCKICDKSYTVRHCWNKHIKCHYIKSDSVTNLKNGMHNNNPRCTSNGQNQFKCGYCKKEYNLIYHWKKHLTLSKECRRHSKNYIPEFPSVQAKNYYSKSKRFECKICKKTYSTDYNRKIHVTNVHGIELGTDGNSLTIETPIQPQINISNEKRRRKSSFNTAFKCNLCGKCYSSVNNLNRHRSLSHSEDRTTTCKICGRSFKHKYTYREHCKSKHKFLLQTNNGLKLNAIISNSSESQRVAGIKNKNITAQNTKKQTKTLLKYECKDCGQHFDTNIILGQHIIQNHPIKIISKRLDEKINKILSRSNSDSSIKCNICFKDFSSLSYLSKHMVMHSGIRPYKCGLCDMSFKFKPNLSMHQKKHNVTVE